MKVYVRSQRSRTCYCQAFSSHVLLTCSLWISNNIYIFAAMSFQCTECSNKPYDKDWKLQRHIRESSKCFEQLNPGISRTRFKCWSCDYTSPREDDLRRHRRRIHPDIAIATGTETEEAGQHMAGRYETSDVAPCLQPVNSPDVNERSDEQFDPHPASESPAAVIKRKTSDPDGLAPDHKRVCIESVLIDLDTLSLVDESDARESSTPKTADSEARPSLTIQQSTSGEFTALVLSTSSAKLQSTRSSNISAPQSMSICGSSIGSLFGRTSIQITGLWMTWSSISPPTASLKSFHSIGMPAPMLGSVDEELSEEPDITLFQQLWCARDPPRRLFTISYPLDNSIARLSAAGARHYADDHPSMSWAWFSIILNLRTSVRVKRRRNLH
jgi:hypothetical protein